MHQFEEQAHWEIGTYQGTPVLCTQDGEELTGEELAGIIESHNNVVELFNLLLEKHNYLTAFVSAVLDAENKRIDRGEYRGYSIRDAAQDVIDA